MKLRTSLLLLMLSVAVVTATIVGGLVLQLRLPEIEQEQRVLANESIRLVAHTVDAILTGYEGQLRQTAMSVRSGRTQRAELDMLMAANPTFEAAYRVDASGKVLSLARRHDDSARNVAVPQISMDIYPQFASALKTAGVAWSDRFLSVVSGDIVIAVGVQMGDVRLIAEILPDSLNQQIGAATQAVSLPLLVVDGYGQWAASNTEIFGNRYSNFAANASFREVMQGRDSVATGLDGENYRLVNARTSRLSWTFIMAVPTGFSNSNYRRTINVVGLGVLFSCLLALLLAPWFSKRAASTVAGLTEKSYQVASGSGEGEWPQSRISELNDLSVNLRKMVAIISEREARLRELNETLERRVGQRTAELSGANQDLEATLANLKAAQTRLVESEKNAALGSMVAGVSHELNTPIGNALTVASALHEEMTKLIDESAKGALRRSSFERLMRDGSEMTELVLRSCQKASNLISSFKRVSVDQSSEQRRSFDLRSLVADYVDTLRPTYKVKPWVIENLVEAGIQCDSFPGAVGQIATNLLQNALVHAFEGRDHGSVRIEGCQIDDWAEVTVTDDGKGISAAVAGHVFEPFFTTRMGTGGSGLGLPISLRLATSVLGGSLALGSTGGSGTQFILRFPLVAPVKETSGKAL